jgi:hypothetical protein|tara:strand:+ start:181 stop:306 length:126 start_codon:yes stop_codon:yes gene_type:complete
LPTKELDLTPWSNLNIQKKFFANTKAAGTKKSEQKKVETTK